MRPAKDIRWQATLAAGLILISAGLYSLHYLVFHDPHHIWIYMLGDIAFVPIEVLLVTIVIHQMLDSREKRQKLEKLNMVIGTFFSTLGTRLLTVLSDRDPHINEIKGTLVISGEWTENIFQEKKSRLMNYPFSVKLSVEDFNDLSTYLISQEDFLIRLLENPTMLEHEEFTELLRALFHLTEELKQRSDLCISPPSDIAHLEGDITRVYGLLVKEWFDYMHYLKDRYPYLFSLAVRTNPFDEEASVLVQQS